MLYAVIAAGVTLSVVAVLLASLPSLWVDRTVRWFARRQSPRPPSG